MSNLKKLILKITKIEPSLKKFMGYFLQFLMTFFGVFLSIMWGNHNMKKIQKEELLTLTSLIQTDFKNAYLLSQHRHIKQVMDLKTDALNGIQAKRNQYHDFFPHPTTLELIFQNISVMKYISPSSLKKLNLLKYRLQENSENLYIKSSYNKIEPVKQYVYDSMLGIAFLTYGYNILKTENAFLKEEISEEELNSQLANFENRIDILSNLYLTKSFDGEIFNLSMDSVATVKNKSIQSNGIINYSLDWIPFQKHVSQKEKE